MAFIDVSKRSVEEKILWMCVLRRAVFDFVLYRGSGKHKLRWQQANTFLFAGRRDQSLGLTFEEICGLFGWEPEYLRRKTKELTRSDIKKLEASRYKDDLDSQALEIVDRNLRWNSIDAATPFLPPYHYTPEYRAVLTPKTSIDQKGHVSFVPRVSWAAAT